MSAVIVSPRQEYFFAFARDPSTQEVYVGGTSRSEVIQWGNVKRTNAMYNGDPGENNPDTSSPVGSSKAFVVKLKSQSVLPDCLSTCDPSRSMIGTDVKSGHCYIDRYCYDCDCHYYKARQQNIVIVITNTLPPILFSHPPTL